MRSRQLLLSFLAGSLVEAARREGSEWGPWLPLPQGDRWILIGMDVVGDDYAGM